MTHYPNAGRGHHWTVRELQTITAAWHGSYLPDGGSLMGTVRVGTAGNVSVRFRFAYKWQGKVCWYDCGTWPARGLKEIRAARDRARSALQAGTNPKDMALADRLERQQRLRAAHELQTLNARKSRWQLRGSRLLLTQLIALQKALDGSPATGTDESTLSVKTVESARLGKCLAITGRIAEALQNEIAKDL